VDLDDTWGYVYRARWSVPLIGYVAIAYKNHRGFFLSGLASS